MGEEGLGGEGDFELSFCHRTPQDRPMWGSSDRVCDKLRDKSYAGRSGYFTGFRLIAFKLNGCQPSAIGLIESAVLPDSANSIVPSWTVLNLA